MFVPDSREQHRQALGSVKLRENLEKIENNELNRRLNTADTLHRYSGSTQTCSWFWFGFEWLILRTRRAVQGNSSDDIVQINGTTQSINDICAKPVSVRSSGI